MLNDTNTRVSRFFGFTFYKSSTENWWKFESHHWDKTTLKLILIAIAEIVVGIIICVAVLNDGEAWVLPIPILILCRGIYDLEREMSCRTYHKHQQELADLQKLLPKL